MKKAMALLMLVLFFSVGANSQVIKMSQGFEGSFPPAGWSIVNVLGTNAWTQGTSAITALFPPFPNGTNCAAVDYQTTGGDDYLVSKKYSGVVAGDSLVFFWVKRYSDGPYPPDSCIVKVSTTDSLVASFTNVISRICVHCTPVGTQTWNRVSLPLTAFAGQNIYVAFEHKDTDGHGMGIDSVFIHGPNAPTPTAVDPTNMCAYTNATLSGMYAFGSDWFGDTVFVTGGGTAGAGSTTVLRYNINSNTMGTNGTPIPEAKAYHSFTRCGSSLYLLGGGASSTGGTTCYKYTPATGTWTSIAPAPVALAGHVAMNWGDSVIFVVAGGWTTYSTSVYAYRPASDTWVTSTSLPAGTGRRSFAGGLTNGKIFVSCGYSGTFRNDLVIGTIGANATTITWATGPVVPFGGGKTGTSRPGGTAINGKFYMITGESTPAPYGHDTIYVFNATTNTWSLIGGGRGLQAASNYWSSVSSKILPGGNIKIFIPGGAVTGFTGQLCCLQVPGCTVTGISNGNDVPKTYSLSQNYPNPFNPVTKINYELPKSGFVTLKIYDVLGKEVATLVSESKTAGKYTVDFDGSSFSSGTYFYRLESNGFVSTKKMMLIK